MIYFLASDIDFLISSIICVTTYKCDILIFNFNIYIIDIA